MHTRIIRFELVDNDVSNVPITRACLLKLHYVTGTTAANGVTDWSGVLLTKIKVWSTTNLATFVSNSVEWQSRYGPTKEDTSSGTFSSPAYLVTRPPPQSLSSFWSNTKDATTLNEVLFYLTAPSGSIVDIHITFTMASGARTSNECLLVTAIGAPTSNTNYYNDLDNTTETGAAGAGRIRPVELEFNLAT